MFSLFHSIVPLSSTHFLHLVGREEVLEKQKSLSCSSNHCETTTLKLLSLENRCAHKCSSGSRTGNNHGGLDLDCRADGLVLQSHSPLWQ